MGSLDLCVRDYESASGEDGYEKDNKMKKLDHYKSVEFSVDSLPVPERRSRIWHIRPQSNFILIRKDSDIAPHLRAGAKLKAKYYFPGSVYHDDIRETTIKEIPVEEQGRFKGHFLIDLEA